MNTVKSQVLADAFECQKTPDVVPIWELEFHAWDSFSREHIVVGNEFARLTAKEQECALHHNADIMAHVAEELSFFGVTVPGGYWEQSPGHPAFWWLPEPARFRQITYLQHSLDDVMLIAGSAGVMAMPDAAGYMDFSVTMFEQPEKIDERAEQTFQHGIDEATKLIDSGVQAVFTPSDIADNHGPFFNPEQMQRFILPYLRKWAERIRDLGAYAILHTDGNIMPHLQEIADSGIHALQAIDPTAGMDIREVRKVGDTICLCGNIDCGLLLTGTADQVYDQTAGLLRDLSGNGGFVLGASNAVQTDVPAENYSAMIRAREAF